MRGNVLKNIYCKDGFRLENFIMLEVVFETDADFYELDNCKLRRLTEFDPIDYTFFEGYSTLINKYEPENIIIKDIRMDYERSVMISLSTGDFISIYWDGSNLIGWNSTHTLAIFTSDHVNESFIENFNESEELI